MGIFSDIVKNRDHHDRFRTYYMGDRSEFEKEKWDRIDNIQDDFFSAFSGEEKPKEKDDSWFSW